MVDNANIDYRGFQIELTAKEFRNLTPSGRTTENLERMKKGIYDGKGVASPTIFVDWNSEKKQWEITGHEGRSRSDAIAELFGINTKIPVHVIPYHLRASNITEEMLNAPFVGQDLAQYDWAIKYPFKGRKRKFAIHQKKRKIAKYSFGQKVYQNHILSCSKLWRNTYFLRKSEISVKIIAFFI